MVDQHRVGSPDRPSAELLAHSNAEVDVVEGDAQVLVEPAHAVPGVTGGQQAGAGGPAGDGSQSGADGEAGDGAGGDSRTAQSGGEDGSAGGGQGEADGSGGLEDGVFGDGDDAQASAGSGGADEFDRSLGDFDAILEAEQEALARTGTGTAADEVFREAAGGTGNMPGGLESTQGGPQDGTQEGGSVGGAQQAGGSGAAGRPAAIRQDEDAVTVEGCEDDDKVARQLCEAATEEADPFLRAALWDEYNEYKKIVARQ